MDQRRYVLVKKQKDLAQMLQDELIITKKREVTNGPNEIPLILISGSEWMRQLIMCTTDKKKQIPEEHEIVLRIGIKDGKIDKKENQLTRDKKCYLCQCRRQQQLYSWWTRPPIENTNPLLEHIVDQPLLHKPEELHCWLLICDTCERNVLGKLFSIPTPEHIKQTLDELLYRARKYTLSFISMVL